MEVMKMKKYEEEERIVGAYEDLGIISGTIADNSAVQFDQEANSFEHRYVYLSGSIFNNGTANVTVTAVVSTKHGMRAASIPLNVGQSLTFKLIKLHTLQCTDPSPSIYYVFQSLLSDVPFSNAYVEY